MAKAYLILISWLLTGVMGARPIFWAILVLDGFYTLVKIGNRDQANKIMIETANELSDALMTDFFEETGRRLEKKMREENRS